METKESRQRCSGHIIAAPQETQDEMADTRYDTCYLGTDLGGKERQFIPRKQITAKTKADAQKQEHYARQPRNLTRRPVRTQEIDAEHVDEQSQDEQVCRPAVDRPYQPSELHLGDDELDALECILSARTVIEQQQDAGPNLDCKQEQRHAAKVVPDRMLVEWNLFVLG